MISAKTFERALIFSARAHENQYRKGDGRPYILHPISVMTRILSVKKSVNAFLLGTAALLHDVVEDCWPEKTKGEKLHLIAMEFGWQVAALVDELTLDKENYEKMGKTEYLCQETLKMSSYALAIKLCDRLDNVCDMESMSLDFKIKYIKETYKILQNLSNRTLTKTHKKLIVMIERELLRHKDLSTALSSYTSPLSNAFI